DKTPEKVDTVLVRTPQERSADLLGRVTAADAKAAKAQAGRKKFQPRIEREYQQFIEAYGYDESPNTRGLFAQYLDNADLKTKRGPVSHDQQAQAAIGVLFTDARDGERLSPTTIGVREALDPRTTLSDDQRAKLSKIVLDDGRNALETRQE